jgi:hypothetical protein
MEVEAHNLLEYDIGDDAGHNDHQQDGVSDVYISSLIGHPEDGDYTKT